MSSGPEDGRAGGAYSPEGPREGLPESAGSGSPPEGGTPTNGGDQDTGDRLGFSSQEGGQLSERVARTAREIPNVVEEIDQAYQMRDAWHRQIRDLRKVLIQEQDNLNTTLEQKANYGMNVPLSLLNREKAIRERIAECEAEIEKLQQRALMPDEPVSTPSGMDQWFHQELQTVREKYFAIVLALFHGLRWADFWDIYQAILDSRDILEDEDIKKGDYLFAQTDEELAAKAKAHIYREEDQAAEIIEFEDEIYPKALLEMLRTRYRPRLVELLPGLGTLGEHRYWEIRARAAYAVAEVAKIDFYRARRQVMEVWARDDRAYVRAAVGYSISRLMEDRVSDSEACKMLDEWSDAKRNLSWKLRWAAAAAYKQVGLDSPEIALPGLRAVARNDDIRVADAVIYALLVISFDDKLEPVLGEMRAWLAEDEGSNGQNVVPLVATLAFLALGNAYTGLVEDESDGDGEGNDDRLLVLLSTDAEGMWRPVAVDALASALKYGLMDEAFDVLKGWARETQENLSRFTAVRDIIADWYMRLWQDAHQIGMKTTWNRLNRWKQDQDTAVKRVADASLSEIKGRVSAAPLPDPSGKKRSSTTIVFG